MKRLAHITICALLVSAGLACGNKKNDNNDNGTPESGLAGAWQINSGELWALPQGAETGLGTGRFLELGAESAGAGEGTAYGEFQSGVRGCVPLLFAVLNEGAVSFFAPKMNRESDTSPIRAYLYEIDGDTLTLTDSEGSEIVLTRADDVPAGFRCEDAVVTDEFPTDPLASSATGLAYDGTDMWYSSGNDMSYPMDPVDGTIGTPVDMTVGSFGQYTHPLAMQGSDFWLYCYCGGSEQIHRLDAAGNEIDTIDTDVDLGASTGIRGADFDGTSLWVGGSSRAPGVDANILQIDSDAEPDTLTQTYHFQSRIDGVAIRNSEFWVLTQGAGQVIAEVDLNTEEAVRTVTLPDDYDWRDMAFVGDDLYLIGTRYADNTAVVQRIDLP